MTISTLALCEIADDVALFAVGAEPAEDIDADGEGLEPLREGGEVLLGEDGCGHEWMATWHPSVTSLEGGAKGYLGLAVADVAADEPVHGLAALHVALHVEDGFGLARRSPRRGRRPSSWSCHGVSRGEGVALGEFAGGVEGEGALPPSRGWSVRRGPWRASIPACRAVRVKAGRSSGATYGVTRSRCSMGT